MACIGNDTKIRFRPRLMKFPGCLRRTNDIIATLNYHGRNVPDGIDIIEQLIGMLHEAAIHKVVRLDARERQRELAYRAGVNLVMYALTGNYKADQVHVPALLERLGQ